MSNPIANAAPQIDFAGAFMREKDLPALPIVLGVVGHRKFRNNDDRGELKKSLVKLFKEFQDAYSSSPLLVVTSLAEGADQLAAEAAIERKAFLRVPLPFEADSYKKSTSFRSPEAQNYFEEHVKPNARLESFVVPLPEVYGNKVIDWDAVPQAPAGDMADFRATCYANAGGHLTRRCHVLVALWNGEPDSAGDWNPAEYVAFKTEGKAPPRYPWKSAEPLGFRGERGVVVVLHTPQPGGPQSDPRKVGEIRVLLPKDSDDSCPVSSKDLPLARRLKEGERLRRRILSALHWEHSHSDEPSGCRRKEIEAELRQLRDKCTTLDDFNRDLNLPKVKAEVRRRIAKFKTLETTPPHSDWLRRMAAARDAAAALSNHLSPGLDAMIAAVFILLGAAVFSFHIYAHWPFSESLHQYRFLFLVGFLILLLVTLGLVLRAWRTRLEERRLDARGLAEGLRVRLSWSLVGIGKSVADSYLGQLRGEVSWIRQALLHVCPPPRLWSDRFKQLTPEDKLKRLRAVREDWVSGQIQHLGKVQKDNHAAARRWRITGIVLAFAGWLMLGVLLFVRPDEPSEWVLIVSSIAVIWGGLFIAFCERRAFEDLAKQYERMRIVFVDGDRELKPKIEKEDSTITVDDIEAMQRVFEALGREAIVEHSQWLVLRRARPLELHIGG
jgi:hypothetical protein